MRPAAQPEAAPARRQQRMRQAARSKAASARRQQRMCPAARSEAAARRQQRMCPAARPEAVRQLASQLAPGPWQAPVRRQHRMLPAARPRFAHRSAWLGWLRLGIRRPLQRREDALANAGSIPAENGAAGMHAAEHVAIGPPYIGFATDIFCSGELRKCFTKFLPKGCQLADHRGHAGNEPW